MNRTFLCTRRASQDFACEGMLRSAGNRNQMGLQCFLGGRELWGSERDDALAKLNWKGKFSIKKDITMLQEYYKI